MNSDWLGSSLQHTAETLHPTIQKVSRLGLATGIHAQIKLSELDKCANYSVIYKNIQFGEKVKGYRLEQTEWLEQFYFLGFH